MSNHSFSDDSASRGDKYSENQINIVPKATANTKSHSVVADEGRAGARALLESEHEDEYIAIVDEAINFSRSLEETLKGVEEASQEEDAPMEPREASMTVEVKGLTDEIYNPRSQQEYEICWASPNAVVSVTGDHAQISICSARRPGLLLTVAHVLEKHNLAVVSQHVSSDQFKDLILMHVQFSLGPADSLVNGRLPPRWRLDRARSWNSSGSAHASGIGAPSSQQCLPPPPKIL
ncbi:unnamed protein product [Spirodela intermedia]|uniref:Uncharacterized protein n=1 Tax=Spirodela intermedia TaxID=51605 RepID=A0A7I8JE04_SPIIN|nr:unnamed protein product [Spirodela intermedia]CAA6668376.1 unnamed protein product [Spirodela intermedia]